MIELTWCGTQYLFLRLSISICSSPFLLISEEVLYSNSDYLDKKKSMKMSNDRSTI